VPEHDDASGERSGGEGSSRAGSKGWPRRGSRSRRQPSRSPPRGLIIPDLRVRPGAAGSRAGEVRNPEGGFRDRRNPAAVQMGQRRPKPVRYPSRHRTPLGKGFGRTYGTNGQLTPLPRTPPPKSRPQSRFAWLDWGRDFSGGKGKGVSGVGGWLRWWRGVVGGCGCWARFRFVVGCGGGATALRASRIELRSMKDHLGVDYIAERWPRDDD
jgi:hypothetical protein